MRTLISIAIIILVAFSVIIPNTTDVITADFGISAILGLVSLALAAAGTGAQISSQNKAEKEAKKYQRDLEKRRNDYEAWFNSEYNRDFLDTDVGRSTVNQLGQTLKNTINTQQNAAVRGGATTEAQVAGQGAAQDVFANALNQLAGYGTQYKQNLRNSYDARIQSYTQPLDALQAGKINNYNALGAQTGDVTQGLINALSMYDYGGGGW